MKPGATALTVNELLDLYLDGLDADQRLSPKTRHDYPTTRRPRRKPLDNRKIRDVTPVVILTWQRRLLAEGGAKDGRPLAPNTIRLARAPLAGAFKLAASSGIVAVNPLMHAPRPKARRSVPRYWSPEQARVFLSLMEGDRTYPVWAVSDVRRTSDRRARGAPVEQRRPDRGRSERCRVLHLPRSRPRPVTGQES